MTPNCDEPSEFDVKGPMLVFERLASDASSVRKCLLRAAQTCRVAIDRSVCWRFREVERRARCSALSGVEKRREPRQLITAGLSSGRLKGGVRFGGKTGPMEDLVGGG